MGNTLDNLLFAGLFGVSLLGIPAGGVTMLNLAMEKNLTIYVEDLDHDGDEDLLIMKGGKPYLLCLNGEGKEIVYFDKEKNYDDRK